jgi:hypothetical protein
MPPASPRRAAAAVLAGAGADVDHPVAAGDHGHVVLHHHDGVAGIHQPVQLRHQLLQVERMQAGCWKPERG